METECVQTMMGGIPYFCETLGRVPGGGVVMLGLIILVVMVAYLAGRRMFGRG